jgi:2',3'-cyclic-nucleotide 2'-phosphodiesterase (5'-nucleotidase family)
MVSISRFCTVILVAILTSCASVRKTPAEDQKIEVRFILVNDVYEIAPVANGTKGGLARVASLKKRELGENVNSFLLLGGDFLSPSVFNSLLFEGKPVRGKQMVQALNAAGLDLAIFGNHEFDIRESELQERIDESSFGWFSSNAFHKKDGKVVPFQKRGAPIPETFVLRVADQDGTKATIGFISVTLPFNKADYVSYTEALGSAKKAYQQLKDSVDAVVALTHQTMEDDRKLVEEIPGLALVLGGHEHDMRFEQRRGVYIAKAHANAISAFVVRLRINRKRHRIKLRPRLVYLNSDIPLDSATSSVVEEWTSIAEKNFSTMGFNPRKIVREKGEPLDGRDATTRTGRTNLTRLIVKAMQDAVPDADVVFMNSGSIRVDDVLEMPLSEYDILRTLPFGGGIETAEIKGSLLIKILEQSEKNTGGGGYLQYTESVRRENGSWKINAQPVDPEKSYKIALTEFLFSGKEANLDFLTPSHPAVIRRYDPVTTVGDPRSDIRMALMRYLEKTAPK